MTIDRWILRLSFYCFSTHALSDFVVNIGSTITRRFPQSTAAVWTPGFFRHIPYTGLLALFGALVSEFGAIGILVSSDGKPIDKWPSKAGTVQPAVLLAVISAFANAFLRLGLCEATTVAGGAKHCLEDV
jgi:hypothetical protein